MSIDVRPDIHTRFKKGQSGNPSGRPKGRKNEATQIAEVLFKKVRIKDANGVRSVSKIVAAVEVCINKALQGDMRAFIKMLDIAEKYDLLQPEPQITTITRIIIDPRKSEMGEVEQS